MNTSSSFQITIEPYWLALTNHTFGSKNLMEHQQQLLDKEIKFIAVDAPTAGGKTLASLLKVLKEDYHSIFTYPTNELMEDQAFSLKKELEQEKDAPTSIIPVDPDTLSYTKEIPSNTDYTIIIANGDSLQTLAEQEQKAKGSALDELLAKAKGTRLLLTNIDLLFLLLKGYYARHRTLFQSLTDFTLLVLDELHLYYGTTLANLYYMLWPLRNIFDQIITTSATHSSSLQPFTKTFPHSLVKAKATHDANKGLTVRHEIDLTISPTDHILYTQHDLKRLTSAIKNCYRKHKKSDAQVKVLTIVNSVVFCEKIAQTLKQEPQIDPSEVGVINGFVPRNKRDTTKEIIIGTSAVEVGIDFDTRSVIFEGSTASSFIQRLGRGARKRDCEQIAFVPKESYRVLYEQLATTNSISYPQLREHIYTTLEKLPSYEGFLSSKMGVYLYLGLLFGIHKSLHPSEKEAKIKTYQNATKNLWKPLLLPKKIVKKLVNIFPTNIINPLSKAGARGAMLYLPAYYEKYKTFSQIDIFELAKLKFSIIDDRKEAHRKIAKNLPAWLHQWPLIHIKGVLDEPYALFADWKEEAFTDVHPIQTTSNQNFSLDLGIPHLQSKIESLLEGKLAYQTSSVEDWRFHTIQSGHDKKLVIGPEALLKAYIDEKNA